MAGLLQDVRYGWRRLRQSPGFTAVAILILALGIGANTAIFSLINRVMLQMLPAYHPEQLVILKWSARQEHHKNEYLWAGCPEGKSGPEFCSFSYPAYEQLHKNQKVLSGIFAFIPAGQYEATVNGETRLAAGDFVTGDYFSTLGVRPALGRSLQSADDVRGAPPVVELSYRYWQERFQGDRSIIGQPIYLKGVPFTVAGVASPGFTGLDPSVESQFWVPLSARFLIDERFPQSAEIDGNTLWLEVGARLKPDIGVAQAESALTAIFAATATNGPQPLVKPADSPRIELASGSRGLASLRQMFSSMLFVLQLFVALVLLITCANLAGIMLARGATRQKEIALRFALGARHKRVIQQLLTESLMLAIAGGGVGVLLAYWGANSLAVFLARMASGMGQEFQLDVHPDVYVLAFTLAVSCLVGIVFGLAPALRATRVNPIPALKESGTGLANEARGRGRHWFGKSLVIAQVAVSVIVLVAAGLLTHTLVNLKTIPMGFDARNILLFDLDTSLTDYKGAKQESLKRELRSQLAALPGVTSATYSNVTLLSGEYTTADIWRSDAPDKPGIQAAYLDVGPDFFETMRIPLLAGRTFTTPDFENSAEKEEEAKSAKESENPKSQPAARPVETPKPRPVVFNRSLALQLFGEEDPLGHSITDRTASFQVIGVVADTKYDSLRKQAEPTVYYPTGDSGHSFELRTAMDPTALIPTVRDLLKKFDSNLVLLNPRTEIEQIDDQLLQERLLAGLSNLFGVLALVLASVGLYGLLSYEVTRRTHEIGVRLAVGAQPADVQNQVIRQGVVLVVIGLIVGILASLGLSRVLTTMLYGVGPADPVTLVAAAAVLMMVALLANLIPARRAAKVDPIVALRCE